MKKSDKYAIVELGLMICGGMVTSDICKEALKNVPLKRSITRGIGRKMIVISSFFTGMEAVAKVTSMSKKIFNVTTEHLDELKKELDKRKEEGQETEAHEDNIAPKDEVLEEVSHEEEN